MDVLKNSHRDAGKLAPEVGYPSTDAEAVAALLQQCPANSETPLLILSDAAPTGTLWVKDERGRMGLGSFKALGAAYAIARDAAELSASPDGETLRGRTYMTASAGNHGLSVAAGARVFGARAVVFIAQTVPESFAERLRARGAEVRREGRDYAQSMSAASRAAGREGATLLSDSSWVGYTDIPLRVMEGYLHMAAEAADQCPGIPTHILLQAGVGGLAAAVSAYARKIWGNTPTIVVVEPDSAPALQASIRAGRAVVADGPDSSMGRLDCKEPSLIALNGLARDADMFLTLSDTEVENVLPHLAEIGLQTTPSGGAGLAAAMIAGAAAACGIDETSKVLAFVSEGPQ